MDWMLSMGRLILKDDDLIRGKVLRQHAPSAASAAHIEDGVDHIPERSGSGAASGLGGRQQPATSHSASATSLG